MGPDTTAAVAWRCRKKPAPIFSRRAAPSRRGEIFRRAPDVFHALDAIAFDASEKIFKAQDFRECARPAMVRAVMNQPKPQMIAPVAMPATNQGKARHAGLCREPGSSDDDHESDRDSAADVALANRVWTMEVIAVCDEGVENAIANRGQLRVEAVLQIGEATLGWGARNGPKGA